MPEVGPPCGQAGGREDKTRPPRALRTSGTKRSAAQCGCDLSARRHLGDVRQSVFKAGARCQSSFTVDVPSVATSTLKPASAAWRAECSTDMFVQAPVMMTVSTPKPCSRISSFVPKNPFIRSFSMTKSPFTGSSPSTGAAPQVPRTRAFTSFTPWKRGALSLSPTAPGSTM